MHTRQVTQALRVGVQIDSLDQRLLVGAVADEAAKELEGLAALGADLEGVVAAAAELLDGALEADAEGVGGEAEDLADGAGDAARVGVHVVDGRELGGDLGVEALREGLWDLVQDVVGCC